jgi:hypothetical protein
MPSPFQTLKARVLVNPQTAPGLRARLSRIHSNAETPARECNRSQALFSASIRTRQTTSLSGDDSAGEAQKLGAHCAQERRRARPPR